MRRALLVLLLVALAAAAWWLLGRTRAPGRSPAGDDARGGDAAPPAAEVRFVGSEACRECHEERHETWLGTAHAYSLRPPSEDTVAGRFDGVPVQAKYFVATPERRGDGWYIRVEGRDGRWRPGDYRVSHVVGRTFEQAYLFTGPRGEWRVLPLCWSIEHGRWDLTHEVLLDIVGSIDRVTEDFDTRVMVFNHGCGQCHATDYDIGHTLPAEGQPVYRSRYLEGAVACESCHGPGSVHADWHREPGAGEYAAPARLLHPKKDLDARGVLDSCGRCHYQHEWRYAIDADPRTSFHDIAITQAHDQGGFFADGRLNGLRYHGTTQGESACFSKGGMSCLSCHRMHGGKRWAMKWEESDDAQCTQCHDADAFGKAHTFHDAVACVDCHMPRLLQPDRVLHFLRDHSIRIPQPELTERFGSDHAPNACSVCHTDRTAGWAREWKETWWGSGGREPAESLARGIRLVVDLRNEPGRVETARLAALAADPGQKRFFRLTALRELGRRDEPAARAAAWALLGDADPEVLQLALQVPDERPPASAGPALMRLLEHPVRTVRVDAAWALARMGWRGDGEDHEALWRDTEAMLVRQGHFTPLLRRIVAIADALGRSEDSTRHLAELVRKTPSAALDGLHRRARWFTEQGRHEDALAAYAEVRGALPEGEEERVRLLYVDSADSLAALGGTPEAAGNWSHAVATFPAEGALFAIADARLRALRGERAEAARLLAEWERKLAAEPWNRELLRRVRWSLRQVR